MKKTIRSLLVVPFSLMCINPPQDAVSDHEDGFELVEKPNHYDDFTLIPHPEHAFSGIITSEDSIEKLSRCGKRIYNILTSLEKPRGFNNSAESYAMHYHADLDRELKNLDILLANKSKVAYGFAVLLALGKKISKNQLLTRNKINTYLSNHAIASGIITPHATVLMDNLELTGLKLMIKGHTLESFIHEDAQLFAKASLSGFLEWFSEHEDQKFFCQITKEFFKPILKQYPDLIKKELALLEQNRNYARDVIDHWHKSTLKTVLMFD